MLCLAAVLAGCSGGGGGGGGGRATPRSLSFPTLDAAVRARLGALSSGLMNGDPETAASLSIGDLAKRDAASARGAGAQERAGDTTDLVLDVVSISSHPLDDGAMDFVAFEKLRSHASGAVFNLVELYHRDAPSAPWKASDRAYFAENVDLPTLRLDAHGSGHLLSAAEAADQKAQPADLAAQYAAAVTVQFGRLPEGTFRAGEFTTGEVTSAADLVNSSTGSGSAVRRWESHPGGEAVALTDGVLCFASLQQVETRHWNNSSFAIQDPRRISLGGLVEPGNYSDLTYVSSVTVAVSVMPQGLPDVVGSDTGLVSAEGRRAPG